MPEKLIVLMIDGISAEYFATCRGRLPNISALADHGLVIENLHSEVLGTSLPGRTSMITGMTADVSGIYANILWKPQMGKFLYANPYDVRVPTLPGRVTAAGREAAVMGFGMIRPEDATIFKPPWWIGEFIQRARDPEPVPADDEWLRVFMMQDAGPRFNAMCASAGFPDGWPLIEINTPADGLIQGMIADQFAFNWAGIVATAPDAPDLIIAEFLITDPVQHATGYKSILSHWAIAQADAAIGQMLARLNAAGMDDKWNIAIMSDHGHSAIKTALRTHVIIPGVACQSEGSVLLVAPKNTDELRRVTEALAAYDCEPFHVDYVPEDHRDQLAAFVSPPGFSFEHDNLSETEATGRPVNISNHGLRPGQPGDDRFAVFYGPDVPPGILRAADAIQVTPTFARLLGLPLDDFPGQPIF